MSPPRERWHSRGQRFDPAYLHHRKSHRKPFGLRCFSLFVGKFQTFYAKMIFPQNRQKWVLSTKSVNKSVFDNKKRCRKTAQRITGRLSQKEKLMSAPIALQENISVFLGLQFLRIVYP